LTIQVKGVYYSTLDTGPESIPFLVDNLRGSC
jgi:hypothetical protein